MAAIAKQCGTEDIAEIEARMALLSAELAPVEEWQRRRLRKAGKGPFCRQLTQANERKAEFQYIAA